MNKLGLHWKENEIMGENMRDPYKTMNRMEKMNKEWLGHHHFQLKKNIQQISTYQDVQNQTKDIS